MAFEPLTLRSITARPVLLKLKRPVQARIGSIPDWPLILIDLETEEGVTGRAYLEPYVPKAMKYLVPALHDLGDLFKGQTLAPLPMFEQARKSLHFLGYEGLAMIAVSGFDMAVWDTVARGAGMPLVTMLGGTPGPVLAYNSNGLWLKSPEETAAEAVELRDEGGFKGLKMRMGRERIADDLEAFRQVRDAVGDDVAIMVDFNQGLNFAEALERCRAIDDLGLAWIEEPILYDNYDGYRELRWQLRTPLMIGENFYGPRELYKALAAGTCDLCMPDFMRIGGVSGWLRSAPIAAAAGIPVSTHLYPEVGAHVMRVTEGAHWLEWQDWGEPILQEPYAVRDSMLEIPQKPGLGLDWDEDVVAANLAEGV